MYPAAALLTISPEFGIRLSCELQDPAVIPASPANRRCRPRSAKEPARVARITPMRLTPSMRGTRRSVFAGRRGMLKAGLGGTRGADAAEPVAGPRRRIQGRGPREERQERDPAVDGRRPEPHRHVGHQSPSGPRESRAVRAHPDPAAGRLICEHLPKQAAMLDRFTIIRSVDARHSNHEPNQVFQTGNLDAAPRINRDGDKYPAIGSMHRQAARPESSGDAALRRLHESRVRTSLGAAGSAKQYDPFLANAGARLPVYTDVGDDTGGLAAAIFSPARGSMPTAFTAGAICCGASTGCGPSSMQTARWRRWTVTAAGGRYLAGTPGAAALDISREPETVRERYGKHLWCQQALLARRLVQAGVAFVTLDLSYHASSGTWDTHGDNIPPYGGISNGWGRCCRCSTICSRRWSSTSRSSGLLDDVLVIAMGEFGRTPQMGTQGSTDGRNHWPVVHVDGSWRAAVSATVR